MNFKKKNFEKWISIYWTFLRLSLKVQASYACFNKYFSLNSNAREGKEPVWGKLTSERPPTVRLCV